MFDDNDDVMPINFARYSGSLLDNNIELKKEFSSLQKKARENAKLDYCYYCGKACNGFCNSHSVPAFCLRNIAVNGEVFYSNSLINIPTMDKQKGVNNAGTFHAICRECDSEIFREYENPQNYINNQPTQKMLTEIVLKNYLKNINKRLEEIELYELFCEKCLKIKDPINHKKSEHLRDISKLDFGEFNKEFNIVKRLMKKNLNDKYYLFFYEKLDYAVPIAFQDFVVLIPDLEGNIINDTFYMSSYYHMQKLYVCVFPLEESSIIMLFVDSENKRYTEFRKQFSKLSLDDKLSVINYIMFAYSSDIFISKILDESIFKDPKLIEVTGKTTMVYTKDEQKNHINVMKDNFDFSQRKEIPNLLSEEYKIR